MTPVFPLILFLPLVLPVVLAVIEGVRDPRKVRIGVYLLTAFLSGGMLILGALLRGFEGDDEASLMAAWVLLGGLVVLVVSLVTLGVMLVLNGVTMVRREGLSPAHLLSLVLGVFILAYLTWGIASMASNSLSLLSMILAGFPAVYLGLGLLAYILWAGAYGWGAQHWGSPVDAVVVLGAGLLQGSVVGPLLAARIDKGVEWERRSRDAGKNPWFVASGGRGSDEQLSEAFAMAAYAREHGLGPEMLLLEDRSRNTAENIRFSQSLLARHGVTRVAVVTSSYHAFRAATLMRAEGMPGYAVGSRTAAYYWPSAMIREYAAILRDHRVITIIGLALSALPLALEIALLISS